MCEILISINPEHVENIFNGTKEYEFRKTISRKNVEKIIIYCTAPVMKVVGEAIVEETLIGDPEIIWKETRQKSGIDESFFFQYFADKVNALAYKLSSVVKYDSPQELSDYGLSFAPQSFVYINR